MISLEDGWQFEAGRAQRTFWLEPTNSCVRYFLYGDAALRIVGVSINQYGIEVTPQDGAFVLDVTNYVALEENTIALRVTGQGGTFRGIRLQAVACEDCPE